MKGKFTKRKLKIISASIIGSMLLLIAVLAACSTLSLNEYQNKDSESGTLDLPVHLEQSGSGDNETQAYEGTSSDETSDTHDTESSISDSESSSVEDSSESESVTETEIAEPSLEFTSHGNGTCSVSGIGSVVDSYIVIPLRSPDGDVVTSISEKAFFGNDTIRAIEIPSTVSDIGDMAFSACSQLVYISVDQDNRSFIDLGGILFSADMTRLISYPSASGASAISLPTSISEISPMAFYSCKNLKQINYLGSTEQWSKISIGEINYGLYSVAIMCTDSNQ